VTLQSPRNTGSRRPPRLFNKWRRRRRRRDCRRYMGDQYRSSAQTKALPPPSSSPSSSTTAARASFEWKGGGAGEEWDRAAADSIAYYSDYLHFAIFCLRHQGSLSTLSSTSAYAPAGEEREGEQYTSIPLSPSSKRDFTYSSSSPLGLAERESIR